MKKLILLFVIFIFVRYSIAQITFQKIYGGPNGNYGYCVQQTTDGGYIIAGYTGIFGAGASDFYLIKTNNNGDTLWTKTVGGTGLDYGRFVQQTSDGGFIAVGYTASFGLSNSNVYLLKIDSNGNLVWSKMIGEQFSEDRAYSVQETLDGNFIILGYTSNASPQTLLIKSDSNGNLIWKKFYSSSSGGVSIQQTTDGAYIIAGNQTNFTGGNEIFLLKTDTSGNPIWNKLFGGLGSDVGYTVQQTTDDGFIIAGHTNSFGAGDDDVFLVKTDSTGNLLWSKTFGGAGVDRGYSVQQTTDGGYIIAGGTNSFGAGSYDAYIIKTNVNGDTLWTKTFGWINNDQAYYVQQTSDNGFIITGYTFSFAGISAVYLIKTDSIGNTTCFQSNTTSIVTAPSTLSSTITWPSVVWGGALSVPPSIVGNGGIVTSPCFFVGLNEIESKSILISPNPSSGYLVITFSDIITEGAVELYNVMGEKILSEKINGASKKEINLKNIASGIYFVKVFDGEMSYCKKLIVE